jgi:UDP-N-acetylglucosamine acyltransferase
VRIAPARRSARTASSRAPRRSAATTASSAHAALGAAPQDKKYRGEPTELHIGDRNTIREFCTFNRGTAQDGGVTRIGDDNWVMAYVHIAHDVQVGSHTILANNATLAGHVHVGDWVIIGGLTGMHQFCKIGAHAMTGFQSHVSQDVPPFMMVEATRWRCAASTSKGLRRRGFSRERIAQVKQMHRLLYRDGLTLEQAASAIAALAGCTVEAATPTSALLLDFLAATHARHRALSPQARPHAARASAWWPARPRATCWPACCWAAAAALARSRRPRASAGPRMAEQGFEAWWPQRQAGRARLRRGAAPLPRDLRHPRSARRKRLLRRTGDERPSSASTRPTSTSASKPG